MSKSEDTLYRQWIMLTKIPRYPRKTTVFELKSILTGEGYIVDTRTIQRDLNKLSILFPLSNETEGRKNYWFWVQEAPIQDLPGMDPVTALAFEMAKSYLKPLLPKATLKLLHPYFIRANEVLNSETKSSLKKWPDKVKTIGRGPKLHAPSIKPEIQQTIYQALLEEKTIQATYSLRGQSAAKDYLIHPLGIVHRMGVVYLICTLWQYDDIKQLALHRFKTATIENEAANIRSNFSLEAYIEDEQQLAYPVDSKNINLKLLFDKTVAEHLAETPLSENQTITIQNDKQVLVTATASDTLELQWWLQAFGSNVEVIEPLQIREKLKETIRQLALIYQ